MLYDYQWDNYIPETIGEGCKPLKATLKPSTNEKNYTVK